MSNHRDHLCVPHEDPMNGAIDRLIALHKNADHISRRDLDLALNEAFRNGERLDAKEPSMVNVRIKGLEPSASGSWSAVLVAPRLYEIQGDPNSVAVGRFKASLRKFLGLDAAPSMFITSSGGAIYNGTISTGVNSSVAGSATTYSRVDNSHGDLTPPPAEPEEEPEPDDA